MILLRYNKEPIPLNPDEIHNIYAKNGLLYVSTQEETYVGYFIKN